MFGKGGFLKRVNIAVDAAVQPGEQRLAAVYVQGPARAPSATAAATGGLAAAAALVSSAPNMANQMSSAWLLAITDQDRVLVLAMDGLTARTATLAASFPADSVTVETASKSAFALAFPDGQSVHYRVLPAWRSEAAAFLELLSVTD